MFSGWGIRTLSADHRYYNPLSYHRGTVWAVEQATTSSACGASASTRARTISRAPCSTSPRSTPSIGFPNAWAATRVGNARRRAPIRRPTRRSLECDRVSPHRAERCSGSFRWRRSTRSSSIPRCPTGCRSSSSTTFASAGRPPRCGSGATRADGRSFEVLHKRGTLHVVRQPPPESLTRGSLAAAPRRHGVSSMTIRLKPLRGSSHRHHRRVERDRARHGQAGRRDGRARRAGGAQRDRSARRGRTTSGAAADAPSTWLPTWRIRATSKRSPTAAVARVRAHRHLGQQRGGRRSTDASTELRSTTCAGSST